MPRLAALATVTSLLNACATGDSDPAVAAVCPPVVEYSHDLRMRAAAEVEALSPNSALVGLLSDYAVMRDQARACRI